MKGEGRKDCRLADCDPPLIHLESSRLWLEILSGNFYSVAAMDASQDCLRHELFAGKIRLMVGLRGGRWA